MCRAAPPDDGPSRGLAAVAAGLAGRADVGAALRVVPLGLGDPWTSLGPWYARPTAALATMRHADTNGDRHRPRDVPWPGPSRARQQRAAPKGQRSRPGTRAGHTGRARAYRRQRRPRPGGALRRHHGRRCRARRARHAHSCGVDPEGLGRGRATTTGSRHRRHRCRPLVGLAGGSGGRVLRKRLSRRRRLRIRRDRLRDRRRLGHADRRPDRRVLSEMASTRPRPVADHEARRRRHPRPYRRPRSKVALPWAAIRTPEAAASAATWASRPSFPGGLAPGLEFGRFGLGHGSVPSPRGRALNFNESVSHFGFSLTKSRDHGRLRPYGLAGLGRYSWRGFNSSCSIQTSRS